MLELLTYRRDSFASKDLIFIPPSIEGGNGVWHPLNRCTWKGPNLRHFKSIESFYPTNYKLFCDVLQVRDLELEHVIFEMRNFAAHENIGYIKEMFNFLHSWFKKRNGALDSEVKALWRQRAFPISTGAKTRSKWQYDCLRTAEAKSEWFIADREDLEASFYGKLPLLAFDFDTNLKLRELFESLGLGKRMLSACVTQRPVLGEPRHFNAKYTNFLRGKLDYIIR